MLQALNGCPEAATATYVNGYEGFSQEGFLNPAAVTRISNEGQHLVARQAWVTTRPLATCAKFTAKLKSVAMS